MKYETAVKVAIECMRQSQSRYAFGATLKKKGDRSYFCIRDARHYDRIEQAIEVLSRPTMFK